MRGSLVKLKRSGNAPLSSQSLLSASPLPWYCLKANKLTIPWYLLALLSWTAHPPRGKPLQGYQAAVASMPRTLLAIVLSAAATRRGTTGHCYSRGHGTLTALSRLCDRTALGVPRVESRPCV